MITKSYWKDGIYYPDQTPVELPLGYEHPESLEQMIARMVQDFNAKPNEGFDSPDEADDFDVEAEEFAGDSEHVWTEMQEEGYVEQKKSARSKKEVDKPMATVEAEVKKGKSPKGEETVVT